MGKRLLFILFALFGAVASAFASFDCPCGNTYEYGEGVCCNSCSEWYCEDCVCPSCGYCKDCHAESECNEEFGDDFKNVCNGCGSQHNDNYDWILCQLCYEYFCQDCADEEKGICNECLESFVCSSCGEALSLEEYYECNVCGELFCTNSDCYNEEEDMCSECAESSWVCPMCNNVINRGDAVHCSYCHYACCPDCILDCCDFYYCYDCHVELGMFCDICGNCAGADYFICDMCSLPKCPDCYYCPECGICRDCHENDDWCDVCCDCCKNEKYQCNACEAWVCENCICSECEGLCLNCHDGKYCHSCNNCLMNADEIIKCVVCNEATCESCFCDQCGDICIDCHEDGGFCPKCYDVCIFDDDQRNNCSNCHEVVCDNCFCSECNDFCLECHDELGLFCPSCDECMASKNVDICDETDRVLHCTECCESYHCQYCDACFFGADDDEYCEACYSCVECAVINFMHCELCSVCYETSPQCEQDGEHCVSCCEENDWLCPNCKECINGNSVELCDDCGLCENCFDVYHCKICNECVYGDWDWCNNCCEKENAVCESCAMSEGFHCPICGDCYEKNGKCENGGEHCKQCCKICYACRECAIANDLDFCDAFSHHLCEKCWKGVISESGEIVTPPRHCIECGICEYDFSGSLCDQCKRCPSCYQKSGHCPNQYCSHIAKECCFMKSWKGDEPIVHPCKVCGYCEKCCVCNGILINEENFPDEKLREFLFKKEVEADSILTEAEIKNSLLVDYISMSKGFGIRSLAGVDKLLGLESVILYDTLASFSAAEIPASVDIVSFYLNRDQTYLALNGFPNLYGLIIKYCGLLGLDLSDCPKFGTHTGTNNFIIISQKTYDSMDQIFRFTDLDANLQDSCILNLQGASFDAETGLYYIYGDSITYDYDTRNAKAPNMHVSIYWKTLNKMEPCETLSSVVISETTFPDDSFRKYVQDHFDLNGDNILCFDEIASAKSIILSDTIESLSLKGIEYFSDLDSLESYSSGITFADFSKNKRLKYLCIHSNENHLVGPLDLRNNKELNTLSLAYVSSISDLKFNQNLKTFAYRYSSADSLDLSSCASLNVVKIEHNEHLTFLDFGTNYNISSLSCIYNNLSELGVSQCTSLKSLICNGNKLKSLDLSELWALTYLKCSNNELTSLTMPKWSLSMQMLLCQNNHLLCLNYDDNNCDFDGNNAFDASNQTVDVVNLPKHFHFYDLDSTFNEDKFIQDLPKVNLKGAEYDSTSGDFVWTDSIIQYDYFVCRDYSINVVLNIMPKLQPMIDIPDDSGVIVDDVIDLKVVVYTVGLDIFVENAASNVYVYDMQGRNVAVVSPSASQISIAVPKSGVYEVVAGEYRKKVICK